MRLIRLLSRISVATTMSLRSKTSVMLPRIWSITSRTTSGVSFCTRLIISRRSASGVDSQIVGSYFSITSSTIWCTSSVIGASISSATRFGSSRSKISCSETSCGTMVSVAMLAILPALRGTMPCQPRNGGLMPTNSSG